MKIRSATLLTAAAFAAFAFPSMSQAAQSKELQSMEHATPALADYTKNVLFGDLWKRQDLSPRDRSLVTVTVLVATGKSKQLPFHIALALDNGVTPAEIGGIITHLAFYTGWPNAVSAAEVADQVFKQRNIPASDLQPAKTDLLPVPANDGARAAAVEKGVGSISPTLAQMTNHVLFDDLWRRQDLTPRDRSLVTIVALTANGDADQLGFHLQKGLENGLTREQLGAAMAQIAFYAGWPKAFSGAGAIAKLGK